MCVCVCVRTCVCVCVCVCFCVRETIQTWLHQHGALFHIFSADIVFVLVCDLCKPYFTTCHLQSKFAAAEPQSRTVNLFFLISLISNHWPLINRFLPFFHGSNSSFLWGCSWAVCLFNNSWAASVYMLSCEWGSCLLLWLISFRRTGPGNNEV